MKAQDEKKGMTLAELDAWVQKQYSEHNRDPREPVRIRVGWRQQITQIWMPENKEN